MEPIVIFDNWLIIKRVVQFEPAVSEISTFKQTNLLIILRS